MENRKAIISWSGCCVFLWHLMVFSLGPVEAASDVISEKFSRNQSQFEKAVADFNFQFSDQALKRLENDLAQTNEIIKLRAQIKKAKDLLPPLKSSFADQTDVPPPSFMSVDVSVLDLKRLERRSLSERTDQEGFAFPSIKEWFLDRQRDWMILGTEVMSIYEDFFKHNAPSRESFKQLVRVAIENIISKGQFVWFEMDYLDSPYNVTWSVTLHPYTDAIKSFRDGTINKDIYRSRLEKQVLHVFLNGREFDYRGFSVRLLKRRPEKERRRWTEVDNPRRTRFQTDANYFPLLNEDHLLALFEVATRYSSIRGALARDSGSLRQWQFEDLKKRKDLSKEELEREWHDSWRETFDPHVPKFSKSRYLALRSVFMSCYVQPAFERNLESLNKKFRTPLNPKKPVYDYENNPRPLPVFATESYLFDHKDPHCRIVGSIFRHIYLKNELELYRNYIAKSGDFYHMGVELREQKASLQNRLDEAKNHLSQLKKEYQEEQEKDSSWWGRSDPEKLESLKSSVDRVASTVQNFEVEKKAVAADLEQYEKYHHSKESFYLQFSRAEKEVLVRQLQEAKDLLTLLEGASMTPRVWIVSLQPMEGISSLIEDTKKNIRSIEYQIDAISQTIRYRYKVESFKRKVANRRIRQLENVLLQSQQAYEGAEEALASLSFEKEHERIQAEWIQSAKSFFVWLDQQHQQYREYEKASALKMICPLLFVKSNGK